MIKRCQFSDTEYSSFLLDPSEFGQLNCTIIFFELHIIKATCVIYFSLLTRQLKLFMSAVEVQCYKRIKLAATGDYGTLPSL